LRRHDVYDRAEKDIPAREECLALCSGAQADILATGDYRLIDEADVPKVQQQISDRYAQFHSEGDVASDDKPTIAVEGDEAVDLPP
jgi:hypothetical protein